MSSAGLSSNSARAPADCQDAGRPEQRVSVLRVRARRSPVRHSSLFMTRERLPPSGIPAQSNPVAARGIVGVDQIEKNGFPDRPRSNRERRWCGRTPPAAAAQTAGLRPKSPIHAGLQVRHDDVFAPRCAFATAPSRWLRRCGAFDCDIAVDQSRQAMTVTTAPAAMTRASSSCLSTTLR